MSCRSARRPSSQLMLLGPMPMHQPVLAAAASHHFLPHFSSAAADSATAAAAAAAAAAVAGVNVTGTSADLQTFYYCTSRAIKQESSLIGDQQQQQSSLDASSVANSILADHLILSQGLRSCSVETSTVSTASLAGGGGGSSSQDVSVSPLSVASSAASSSSPSFLKPSRSPAFPSYDSLHHHQQHHHAAAAAAVHAAASHYPSHSRSALSIPNASAAAAAAVAANMYSMKVLQEVPFPVQSPINLMRHGSMEEHGHHHMHHLHHHPSSRSSSNSSSSTTSSSVVAAQKTSHLVWPSDPSSLHVKTSHAGLTGVGGAGGGGHGGGIGGGGGHGNVGGGLLSSGHGGHMGSGLSGAGPPVSVSSAGSVRSVSPNSGLVHYFSMITDPHGHMPSPAHTGPPGHGDPTAAVHYSMWNTGGLEVSRPSAMSIICCCFSCYCLSAACFARQRRVVCLARQQQHTIVSGPNRPLNAVATVAVRERERGEGEGVSVQ